VDHTRDVVNQQLGDDETDECWKRACMETNGFFDKKVPKDEGACEVGGLPNALGKGVAIVPELFVFARGALGFLSLNYRLCAC
jgi:hypothetical protein